MTLLHFIALTVKEKYPELANFWHELHFVEKAAAGEGSQPAWDNPRKRGEGMLGPLVSGFCYLLFDNLGV